MAIITLTTDLGIKDFYVAAIKGSLLGQLPDARVVDISHHIAKFDIAQAAFVLKTVMTDFPEGTVHVVGVHTSPSPGAAHLAALYKGHYFIGADNGFFSLLFDVQPDAVVELTLNQDSDVLTFPTKNLYVKAACHLARGGTLEVIGKAVSEIQQRTLVQPVTSKDFIRGSAIYIDSYGNVITNITREMFKRAVQDREFAITFRLPGYDIEEISSNYCDVPEGERLALFGSSNRLEIAIHAGHASNLLGIQLGDSINIEVI